MFETNVTFRFKLFEVFPPPHTYTYIYTYTRTYRQTYIQTDMHTDMHTYILGAGARKERKERGKGYIIYIQ